MIIFQVFVFCIVAIGVITLAVRNLTNWAAHLRNSYTRDIKNAFGEGWFNTPSLLVCKIHVIFLVVLSLLVVFYLCFGTIYL